MSTPEENRQWDLMSKIEEWMDVYVWEVDQATIKFANKKSKIILRLIHLLFYGNLKKIEKYASKNGKYITVGDVISWSEYMTTPRKNSENE